MRVLVFGAGALGSVLGAMLSRAHEVCLITRGRHLEEIVRRGVIIEGLDQEIFYLRATDTPKGLGRFDLVLVTTKSYDTGAAAQACIDSLSPNSAVLTVQNGIGNGELLASVVGAERVTVGVTSMAAHMHRPGVIKFVAEGKVVLGALQPESTAPQLAEQALTEAGVVTEHTDNIVGAVWSKAIANAVINPLTAILNCRNGLLAENDRLRGIAELICREGSRVAEACGISLNPPDVLEYSLGIARRTSENRSSMLMDLQLGRRTEIEAICGSIARAASERGLETPVISALLLMVRYLEVGGHHQKA